MNPEALSVELQEVSLREGLMVLVFIGIIKLQAALYSATKNSLCSSFAFVTIFSIFCITSSV